jgi:hypothetical protein
VVGSIRAMFEGHFHRGTGGGPGPARGAVSRYRELSAALWAGLAGGDLSLLDHDATAGVA